MGKISDALEKKRKDSTIKVERLPIAERPSPEKRETDPELAVLRSPRFEMDFSPKLVVLSAPDSADAENFKILRAQILFPKTGSKPRSILVTSAIPGEGKTFVAANLAASIAIGVNEHVLLVDCDLRRPSLHLMFGYANARGLRDYLMGQARLEDLIIRTPMDKLSILPAGNSTRDAAELLSSSRMRDFLAEVKDRYDDRYIVLDGTPSEVTAEASVLSQNVDGVLYVVRAQRAPRALIKRSIQNLSKGRIIGIAFNGYEGSHRHYTKYYKKYYKNY
jgi:exopolysaccharide/PEP-CTERM locus tyrosine autokinase